MANQKHLLAAAIILAAINVSAAPSSSGIDDGYGLGGVPQGAVEPSSYHQGLAVFVRGDLEEALKLFEKAQQEEPKNPDVYNMLAFTQRKTGKLDEAFVNYKKALELKPDFPQAREYLGEAHLQAALRELETLKSYGKDGTKDYDSLKAAFQSAAKKLEEPAAAKPGAKSP